MTFTGGSRIAASALAVTSDAVFVTGSLFFATLPATLSALKQSHSHRRRLLELHVYRRFNHRSGQTFHTLALIFATHS